MVFDFVKLITLDSVIVANKLSLREKLKCWVYVLSLTFYFMLVYNNISVHTGWSYQQAVTRNVISDVSYQTITYFCGEQHCFKLWRAFSWWLLYLEKILHYLIVVTLLEPLESNRRLSIKNSLGNLWSVRALSNDWLLDHTLN